MPGRATAGTRPTPGWWGGAHPFGLLDFSVVHNGEISSYDANRRYIEMFGYKCTLQTDTEVITYIIDYLVRKRGLTLDETAHVIAPSFWATIAEKDEESRERETLLRRMFPSLLITGPFSIILGYTGVSWRSTTASNCVRWSAPKRAAAHTSPAKRAPYAS